MRTSRTTARGPGRATNTTGSGPPPSATSASTRASKWPSASSRVLSSRASSPSAASSSGRPAWVRRPASSAGSAPRSSTAATRAAAPALHVVDDGLVRAARLEARAHDARRDGPGRAAALSIRSAPASRLSLDAPPSRTIARTCADQPRFELRAAQLEARAGPGRRPEHDDHPPARGVVGLDELDARAPEAGLDEPPAHRLARRLRLLLPVALPRLRAGEHVERGRGDGVARTRPARSRRARAGRRGSGTRPGRRARTRRASGSTSASRWPRRASASATSRPARSRRAGQSGSPGRSRAMRATAPAEITRSPSTAHRHQQRRRDRPEHDVDPRLALAPHELDRARPRSARWRRSARPRAAPPRGRAGGRARAPRTRRGAPRPRPRRARRARTRLPRASRRARGGERERQHQRDCRIRTSKAQPRSAPVLAVPGSVRVSSSEKRSVSVYSTARIRSSVPRRSCE